jgi:hypothetical protein
MQPSADASCHASEGRCTRLIHHRCRNTVDGAQSSGRIAYCFDQSMGLFLPSINPIFRMSGVRPIALRISDETTPDALGEV